MLKKLIVIIIVVIIANIMLVLNKHTIINDIVINNKNMAKYSYQEGSYTGIGEGFVDDIEVEVIFKKDETGRTRIVEINILKSDEVTKYWKPVKEKIINEILEKQALDVDTVTGATESSKGLLEAIKDARKKAISRN